jgi:DNA-binding beta-propeller fold protein YncE
MIILACGQGEKQQNNQSGQIAEMKPDTFRVELEKVWETGEAQLITPECATYDPEMNIFYVSNLNRDNELENDGYISIVNADGSVNNARWVEGLTSPLGNDFYNGHLFVNDGGNIVKINIESGNVIEKISVEGATDLNGIDIDEAGNIYAADSDGNKIYKVTQNGEVTLLFEGGELNEPNGVFIKDEELIVASMSGNSLLSFNLETNQIKTLVEGIGGADGIVQLEGGHFLTSNWSGEIYFISNDMQKQRILDTTVDKINAADITYIPHENLLVIPTFFDNRLMAYKVSINEN